MPRTAGTCTTGLRENVRLQTLALNHSVHRVDAIRAVVLDRPMETPWSPCTCRRRGPPRRRDRENLEEDVHKSEDEA